MDKVVLIGNCQATALEMMLRTNSAFAERFEFVSFPPVHEFPEEMVPALHRAVADASVLIPQRIDDAYRAGMGLGTNTLRDIAHTDTVVRWPSVYWAGYFPDLFYARDASGRPVVDDRFDYHDRVILRAYGAGIDVAGACALLEDAERPSNAQEWAAHATAELEIRGKDCEVQVTSFISSHFREELLFFTMNHPTNRMLAFIAQEITELLAVPGSVDAKLMPGEVLESTFYPLHANHVRALDLSFGAALLAGRTPFRIRGTSYELADAVQVFYEYYDEHPQLVELNLDP
ncbi:MAG: WcbI family polysaccharide biosynthesis putative acetyltransferase [Solirubrobacteraceae bacterium]